MVAPIRRSHKFVDDERLTCALAPGTLRSPCRGWIRLMIRRHTPLIAVAFASLTLAACNAARAPVAVATVEPASRNVTPSDFTLPDGAGCSGAIARYRAILDNDLAMGHVERGVFASIQGEIDAAAAACSAGREAQAVSLIRASRARHGYPG